MQDNGTKDYRKNEVSSLIDRECEGEKIEHSLMENVLGTFVKIGMGDMGLL